VAQAGPTATPQPGATPTPAKEVPAPPSANQRRKDRCSYPGPYSYLDGTDNVRIESGRVFSSDQKRKILQANRARNGGFLRSDLSGEPLVPPMGGVRYVPYVAHVDHIIPKTAGGTKGSSSIKFPVSTAPCKRRSLSKTGSYLFTAPNSYSNACVLSGDENLHKSDN